MLSLQGNTTPYLLYALVRIAGVGRKAGETVVVDHSLSFDQPQEWLLIKKLLKFDT